MFQYEKIEIKWVDSLTLKNKSRVGIFVKNKNDLSAIGEFSPIFGYSRFWKNAANSAKEAAKNIFKPKILRDVIDLAYLYYSKEQLEKLFLDTKKVNLKVKINSIEDIEQLINLNNYFENNLRLRIDFNGYLSIEDALDGVKIINNNFDNIDYIEQPVSSIAEMSQLKILLKENSIDINLAIDEAVQNLDELNYACQKDSFDILVLRTQHCGGVEKGILWSQLSNEYNKKCVVSTLMETSIGNARGILLAKSIPNLFGACGLVDYTI